jgi:hypothetical protein
MAVDLGFNTFKLTGDIACDGPSTLTAQAVVSSGCTLTWSATLAVADNRSISMSLNQDVTCNGMPHDHCSADTTTYAE